MHTNQESVQKQPIAKMNRNVYTSALDPVVVESPLEIRLSKQVGTKNGDTPLTITMRTPGDDLNLATGFLFAEGIIKSGDDIVSIKHCGSPETGRTTSNTLQVELKKHLDIDLKPIQRNFSSTSSCGVCGKSSLEALALDNSNPVPLSDAAYVTPETIHQLPTTLRTQQSIFKETGGLHAAALFDFSGNLLDVREDIGRHNAFDKLIGRALKQDLLNPIHRIALVSGRVSYEIMQKALVAQIPIVAAVGAASSLAIEIAKTFNITLIGFLRDQRCNIYSHPYRITEKGPHENKNSKQ